SWPRTFSVVGHVLEIVQHIDAANEPDGVIDHTGFAVHATQTSEVEESLPQALRFWPVDAMTYAAFGQHIAHVQGRFIATEAVQDHPDLHSTLLGATECVHHPTTRFIQIEDVG